MRKTLFFMVLIIFVSIIKSIVGNEIGFRFIPDLFLMVVVYAAWSYGPLAGEFVGFIAGAVADTFGLGIFGANMVIYTCLGYAIGTLIQRIARHNMITLMVIMYISSVLYIAGFYSIHVIGKYPFSGAYSFSMVIFKPLIYALWVPIVFWLFNRLAEKWFGIEVSDGAYT